MNDMQLHRLHQHLDVFRAKFEAERACLPGWVWNAVEQHVEEMRGVLPERPDCPGQMALIDNSDGAVSGPDGGGCCG